MTNLAATEAVDDIVTSLLREFGEQLLALYLYGSLADGTYQPGRSDINLLAVFDERLRFHEIRARFRPDWQKHSKTTGHAPLITAPDSFRRHLRLNPIFADHLVRESRLLAGSGVIFPAQLPDPEPEEALARFCRQAMLASATLAPSLLAEQEATETLDALRSLVRRQFGRHIGDQEEAVSLFATIQSQISREFQRRPELIWSGAPTSGAPPLLQGLQSVYETEDRLVLVVPDLEPDEIYDWIIEVDWLEVARRAAGHYKGLRITTPSQLRLLLGVESAADYHLQSYDHAWGADALGDLDPVHWRVLRDLGRAPSNLQIAGLSHAYFATDDADLPMLIHDIQNQLLNIQLRNELLGRVDGMPVVAPPEPLPARSETAQVRLDAIFQHLGWWADYYTNEMEGVIARNA